MRRRLVSPLDPQFGRRAGVKEPKNRPCLHVRVSPSSGCVVFCAGIPQRSHKYLKSAASHLRGAASSIPPPEKSQDQSHRGWVGSGPPRCTPRSARWDRRRRNNPENECRHRTWQRRREKRAFPLLTENWCSRLSWASSRSGRPWICRRRRRFWHRYVTDGWKRHQHPSRKGTGDNAGHKAAAPEPRSVIYWS